MGDVNNAAGDDDQRPQYRLTSVGKLAKLHFMGPNYVAVVTACASHLWLQPLYLHRAVMEMETAMTALESNAASEVAALMPYTEYSMLHASCYHYNEVAKLASQLEILCRHIKLKAQLTTKDPHVIEKPRITGTDKPLAILRFCNHAGMASVSEKCTPVCAKQALATQDFSHNAKHRCFQCIQAACMDANLEQGWI